MSDVDEVKSRTNIVDIIGNRITLKKAGRHFKALCPFHSEKTPSFIVSPERGTWKCFGCGKGGSVIDFVMEYEHVDFPEALETLAEKAGVKLERRNPETPEAKLKQKLYEVNHLASEFYHFLLTKHALGEKARLYLKNRGVTDKTIETFLLGYSPNSWDGLAKYLKKKGYDGGTLEQAGLIISSARGGYDRFRGRVMFTLKDHRGNAVGFSGRLLDPDAKEAKYINTSETPVYNKSNLLFGLDVTREAIARENQAVIMEGEFDVISSFQAGIGNVVAIKGSALTDGHVNLLHRFTDRIVFALDSDLAGDAAARRGISVADRAGMEMRVVTMPSGKDPDEAARENPGIFKKAIKDAEPVYDYYLSSAMKRIDPSTAYGKKQISDELTPVLFSIENFVVQEHYVKQVARAIDTTEEAIRDGMRKYGRRSGEDIRIKTEERKPSHTRSEKLEIFILALLLGGKMHELFEELSEDVEIGQFSYSPLKEILYRLKTYLTDHTVFLVKDFADNLPAELVPVFDEAFLWDIEELVSDDVRFAKEWDKTLVAMRKDILHRQIQDVTAKLGTGTENEETLQQALAELSKKLSTLEKKV